jgi:Pentapeptide repeats (8 copies)
MLHTSPRREEYRVAQQQQDGQQQEPRWQPTRRQLLWTGATVGLLLLTIAVVIGYRYDITVWDWLKLLIVPVVIAGGGLWFNRQQRERELEIARQQREQELDISERRTQDEALQAYLDQMSDMLLPNKDRPSLYKARAGDSLSSVARARTLTALPRLDEDRKARVVQFLHESGLITKNRPILDLSDTDLSDTDLDGAVLDNADLAAADLRFARGLTEEQLRVARSLERATMPNGQQYEDWIKDRSRDNKNESKRVSTLGYWVLLVSCGPPSCRLPPSPHQHGIPGSYR